MATYQEFREQYEMQHPASVPQLQDDTNEYPIWLLPMTFLMFLSVSVVSGAHTTSTVRTTLEASLIPENAKFWIALFAFFGFELALFVSVFSWLRSRNAFISYISTAVVFVVIVLANIQDVARSLSFSDWFSSTITIGVGFGTPLVALLSGKIFVDVYRSNRNATRQAKIGYVESMKAWDAKILSAWTKEQKQQTKNTRQTDKIQTIDLSIQTDRQTDKVQTALDYIRANPESIKFNVRELGVQSGVGKDSAAKAKKIYQSNGHING